jgi:hypothetical protein
VYCYRMSPIPSAPRLLSSLLFAAAATVLLASPAAAQGLTGALIGTVKDDQGGVLSGAEVRVSSPALIGADLPRTGVGVAASLQYFTGKPWAATAQIPLPQNNQQRILLEAPGSRRLSSQTLLDLRVSRRIDLGGVGFELLVDVLNLLNDTAEEGLATDNLFSVNFAQPTVFMDPRRAMVGVKVNLGR